MSNTTESSITFDLGNLEGERAPLYHHYVGQVQQQPAYIQMDEDGKVTADWSGEVGSGVPSHVWHNRTLRWSVNPHAKGDALAKFLRDDAAPLLQVIHAEHSVSWDGNNNRGRLTAKGEEASDKLERLIEATFAGGDPDYCAQVWTAWDWLFVGGNHITEHWAADQALDDAVAALEKLAEADDIEVDGDIRTELLDRAQRMFDEDGDDGLGASHLTALVADGRITQEQAAARSKVD